MKQLLVCFLGVLVWRTVAAAQDHIIISHDHSGRICWGYATGRAGGKARDDATCNPNSLYQSEINGSFFTYYAGSSLSGIQTGDIILFLDHAAYVVATSPQIKVDHTGASWSSDVLNVALSDVVNQFGNPLGYYRRKTFGVTVQNSFGGGMIKVNGGTYSSGSNPSLSWTTTHTLEAIDQNYQAPGEANYFRVFDHWNMTGYENVSSANPFSVQVDATTTYTAVFNKRFDVRFENSFVLASGGQVKVSGVTHTAPFGAHVNEQASVAAEALYEVIDGIQNTFQYWTNNRTNDTVWSSSTTFYPADHTTYTAHFGAKPVPVSNLITGDSVGSPVQVSWSEHPNENVNHYKIWRQVKHNGVVGPEYNIASVNRGTTSYTDYSYLMTDGYTHDLVWYDARAHLSINDSYADPQWYANYAQPDNGAGPQLAGGTDSERPPSFSMTAYPNPFNPVTTIRYALPAEVDVVLRVYTTLGQLVTTLVDEEQTAGYKSVALDGVGWASGIYIVRIKAGSFTAVRKILLTR
jgi:hypothetical protein